MSRRRWALRHLCGAQLGVQAAAEQRVHPRLGEVVHAQRAHLHRLREGGAALRGKQLREGAASTQLKPPNALA